MGDTLTHSEREDLRRKTIIISLNQREEIVVTHLGSGIYLHEFDLGKCFGPNRFGAIIANKDLHSLPSTGQEATAFMTDRDMLTLQERRVLEAFSDTPEKARKLLEDQIWNLHYEVQKKEQFLDRIFTAISTSPISTPIEG